MIKYFYPDGKYCYRALNTTHTVYQSEDGKLIARTMRPDNSELYEFEILGFELLETGKRYQ